ncbi:MAG: ATP-binding cassette domain-containing protein [Bacillota bacterium]|nr:ATP-binding cassette domain-containing protein [Bacillota bacterium]
MGKPCVRLVEVAAGYPGRPVFDGANLEVAEGEFLGVAGPNGAGKTTLLRLILGFLKPARGLVEVLGGSSSRPASLRAARRQVGYVPQGSGSGRLPMSVFDSVLVGRWGKGFAGWRRPSLADRQAVEEVLERLGLTAYRNTDLRDLSGGLRQRVALGRAVVREPRLVLMDEPTTFLDRESQAAFLALAGALNRVRGITFLVISHDHQLLAESCSRIVTLKAGRIVTEP